MISEYLLFFTFFSLSFLLLLSTLSVQLSNQMLAFKGTDRGEFAKQKNKRLDTWYKILLLMIGIVILFRLCFLFVFLQEALKLEFVPASTIHLLLTSIVFLTFWMIFWYFLYLKNEIKLEQKFSYLKIYFMIVLVTGILDVFISLAIYLSHFYGYFTLKTMDSSESMAIAGSVFPLLVFICILIILMVLLFILFILKRSVRILKQYYLTVLIAIISALLMFVLRGLQHLGWYENVESQLLLFSVSYSYLGYIFLALLIVTIFSNATSILIYANLEKFTNTIKFKHRVITFIKIGFVTLIAFIILSIVPDLLIWIYT